MPMKIVNTGSKLATQTQGSLKTVYALSRNKTVFRLPWVWVASLEPVFTIFIGRFDGIKARIQGKKHSKVGHLASIF